MAISNLSLLSSAVFYILIGVWWHLQITKRYWSSKQRRTDFSSTVTFPCCNGCSKIPIEGLYKLLFSVSVCAVSMYQLQHWTNDSEHNQGIGQLTVFSLFGISSLCDIISEWCHRILFPGLDYLLMVVCFNVQSVVLSYHSSEQNSWMAIADTCAMYAASVAAIALLLEFKYKHKIWFPLLRSFSTVVLGTWLIHLYIVLWKQDYVGDDSFNNGSNFQQNVTQGSESDVSVKTNDQYSSFDNLSLVPMYFTWHCLFNMNILTILWLLSWKLADRNCCMCMPEEENVPRFENRVHFDYHMITRMTDSDVEP